ncbi:MAG: cytochrome c, class [Alphaproteobacteria bacterium]|nr:cytochrome c, class [Alphaproteobacteria bacterium]MDB5740273.1 cytochrome c, class [Alphaproteobacteria bacterium]
MAHSLKLIAAAAAALLALSPLALRAQAAKPALYTADQATAGVTVYTQACAACHGAALEGVSAPALKGAAFGEMATAQNLTVDSLLDVIASSMPQSDPGSLKPEEVGAVTAYILQQNSYPAGTAALARGGAGLKDVKVTP